MTGNTVQLEKCGAIFRVNLNVPDRLNAISEALIADLISVLDACKSDPAMRVLVLTGTGSAFCAGADLNASFLREGDVQERKSGLKRAMDKGFNELVRRLIDMPAPTVAAVNGTAAGGGCGLALACDIVIAAESAKFIFVFTSQLGLIPDMGCTWHLARTLGRSQSIASAFFGEPISAPKAEEYGMIWKSVPDADFPEFIDVTAERLSCGPQRAYVATRHALDKALLNPLEAQLDLEAEIQPDLLISEEFAEGVDAFFHKRKPQFNKN